MTAPRARSTEPSSGQPAITTASGSAVSELRIQPTPQAAVVGEILGVDVFAFASGGAFVETTDLALSLSGAGEAS